MKKMKSKKKVMMPMKKKGKKMMSKGLFAKKMST